MKPWHLTARPALSLMARLRLLFGVPLFVRFTSPDGNCHAACDLSVAVQRDWPDDPAALTVIAKGWPPLVAPLPPPPPHPLQDPGSR